MPHFLCRFLILLHFLFSLISPQNVSAFLSHLQFASPSPLILIHSSLANCVSFLLPFFLSFHFARPSREEEDRQEARSFFSYDSSLLFRAWDGETKLAIILYPNHSFVIVLSSPFICFHSVFILPRPFHLTFALGILVQTYSVLYLVKSQTLSDEHHSRNLFRNWAITQAENIPFFFSPSNPIPSPHSVMLSPLSPLPFSSLSPHPRLTPLATHTCYPGHGKQQGSKPIQRAWLDQAIAILGGQNWTCNYRDRN